eukprot:m.132556 g.132556  ORF g.132556 m.132556 type:complete len:571 (-) comp22457_c0_seq1:132-1844(-)
MGRKSAVRNRGKAAAVSDGSGDEDDGGQGGPSTGYAALRGMLLGATAAAVVIGLAVLLVGTPQDGASTTAPLAYGAADPDAGAAVNPPPPVNSPPPVAKRSVPPPSQMPTIATTNNGKSIGTWRDPSASASLTDLSTKVGEWQQMLKKVNYNSKQAGKLENKIVLLLEKLDETFDVAPQSEWQEELNTQLGVTYFAFARSRLRLEFFRDTHDHRKAYTAAMEAMANPVCPAQECAVTVLRYALLTAHRAGNPDGWAEAALKFAKSDPRLSPLVTIANAHKFPTMGEVDLKLGDKPVRLVSNPFWTSVVSQMGLPSRVERESAVVIEELEGILNKDGSFKQVKTDKYMKQREVEGFLPNARDLCNERVTGPQQCWQEFILYAAEKEGSAGGKWNDAHCKLVPRTCAMLQHRDLIGEPPGLNHKGVPGKASFIRLKAGQKIIEHCGPHPYRVTCHLGLRIPEGASIRVLDEEQGWTEGKITAIDDAYIHSVNNANTTHDRYILLFHVWHPSLIHQVGFTSEKAVPYANAIPYEDPEDEPADDSTYFAEDDDDEDDVEAPPVKTTPSGDDDDE